MMARAQNGPATPGWLAFIWSPAGPARRARQAQASIGNPRAKSLFTMPWSLWFRAMKKHRSDADIAVVVWPTTTCSNSTRARGRVKVERIEKILARAQDWCAEHSGLSGQFSVSRFVWPDSTVRYSLAVARGLRRTGGLYRRLFYSPDDFLLPGGNHRRCVDGSKR